VTVPAQNGADAAAGGCIAPRVVGVNLAMARRALRASGCRVIVRQLPAHGTFVTPASPDGRQLVARQSPKAGHSSRAVTVWVRPLCAQAAEPGPARRGPVVRRGPTELIAGLYLAGGPARTGPHCRRGVSHGGTVIVSTPAGEVVKRRQVREGRFAIFPLRPGSYVVEGTLSGGSGGASTQTPATTVSIRPHHTTRLNLVAAIP
jgi:hypothetical protein